VILRASMLPAIVACALLASACDGGGGGATASGGATSSLGGSLIMTRPEGLFELNIKSGEAKLLVPIDAAGAFMLDPAVSPDASKVAYILQPPPTIVEGRYDSGADIWVADRDGSNARAIFTHEEANQLVRYPRWLDEQTIFAVIQIIEEDGGVAQTVYSLQRIDVATGERTIVRRDVLAFDISPDGKRIVYAALAPSTGETLQAIDIDGTGHPVEVVGVSAKLAPFNSPAYAPAGGVVAFAAADQTLAPPKGELLVSRAPVPGAVTAPDAAAAPAGARAAALDGLPEDIWTVSAGGGTPQMVADLKEDLPSLTWGGDGDYIFVLGANALYQVNMENGAVERIGEGVFHGQIAWAPGR